MMVWLLFFIAVGFAIYYKNKYEDADNAARFFKNLAGEWQEKFHEVVREVTNKK